MDNKGQNSARRIVSERLRKFFAHLTAQPSSGTADLWAKVEARLASRPPEAPTLNTALTQQ
jgi:hypothetical protein